MSSSAEPLFNSRSRARVLIPDMNRYYVDRHLLSTCLAHRVDWNAALQKLLLNGWVNASPAISDTGRAVREYKLTPAGRKQLELERANYRRVTAAIGAVLDTA